MAKRKSPEQIGRARLRDLAEREAKALETSAGVAFTDKLVRQIRFRVADHLEDSGALAGLADGAPATGLDHVLKESFAAAAEAAADEDPDGRVVRARVLQKKRLIDRIRELLDEFIPSGSTDRQGDPAA